MEFPEFKSFQMVQNINYLAEYFVLTVKARHGKEKSEWSHE